MSTKLTPVGRVSFPNLYKAQSINGSDPKYDLTLLFDKATDLSVLKEAAEQAAKDKWGDKIPKNLRSPFRDGGEKDLDGYDGKTFVRFSSKQRPGVVDAKKEPIEEDSGRVYAGMFARVSFTVYAYDTQGNKGVSFGLNNVQKIGDGEPFGTRSNPDDDFDEIEPGNVSMAEDTVPAEASSLFD